MVKQLKIGNWGKFGNHLVFTVSNQTTQMYIVQHNTVHGMGYMYSIYVHCTLYSTSPHIAMQYISARIVPREVINLAE